MLVRFALQLRFAEIVGEPSRSPNKKLILRRMGEALKARHRRPQLRRRRTRR